MSNGVSDAVSDGLSQAGSDVPDAMSDAMSGLSQAGSDVSDAMSDGVSDLSQVRGTMPNSVSQAHHGLWGSVWCSEAGVPACMLPDSDEPAGGPVPLPWR